MTLRLGAASDAVPRSRRYRLAIAIAVSLAVHGLLLALHIQFPEASKTLRKKALEVVLVNSRSAEKPAEAEVLAQNQLDGGGIAEDKRHPRTPLPPTARTASGKELQQMRQRVQTLEKQHQQMLTQAKNPRAVAPVRTAGERPLPTPSLNGFDLAESARAMARLEGEISKTSDDYSQRPRKKFVGARAEEYALAAYLDAWRQKIERVGTLNYPDEARGKIYGSVVIFVELRADDGSVFNAEISRSSGHKVLDQAALRILKLAAPFGPVPRQPLAGANVLSFARTWHFTQGDALNTASK